MPNNDTIMIPADPNDDEDFPVTQSALDRGRQARLIRQTRTTKEMPMKKAISDLTAQQKAEIEALARLPDDQINTNAIPEQKDWSNARRGLFAYLADFDPKKHRHDLSLDAAPAGTETP